MRKICMCLFLGFLIHQVQAQVIPFEIENGAIQRDKITKRTYGIEPIATDKEHFYYLYLPYMAVYGEISHGSVENYFIGKYRKDNLEQVVKKEIELDFNNRKRQFHGVFHIKNSFYLFSAFQNEQHKKHYLFVQTINKETLDAEDDMKMIGEIDYSGINKYNNTYFHHEFSPDSSMVLVYYNIVNNQNENLRYGMYVYSDQMELIWKKENVIPTIKEGVFAYQRFRIDNQGNVYLKGTNYTNLDNYYASSNFKERGFFSKDTYYADHPNYTTQLYKYYDGGQKEIHVDLSIPGKFIRSLTFLPEDDGKVLCAGIYSNPGMISAQGSFVFHLEPASGKVSNLVTEAFGNELIELGFDETQIKRFRRSMESSEEWDPFDYILTDIRTDARGDKYFIAEQFIEGTKVENSGKMITYRTIFLHNDLFVTRIGAENRIERIDKVSKRQYLLTTSQFNSFTVLEKEGVLYFLFKEFLKKETMFKNAEEGNGYVVELDPEGKQERAVFQAFDSGEDLYLMPGTGIQTSEDELVYSTTMFNFKDYSVNKLLIGE